MAEKKVSSLQIDNWDTGQRGLSYLNRTVREVAGAYVLGQANPVVNEMLAVYKSQKAVSDEIEKAKDSAKKKR